MARVAYDRLWCEAGSHHWERLSQRGRTPKNCQDHNPNKQPRKAPSERRRRPKSTPVMVEDTPEISEPQKRSKGVYVWLSNADIEYLKRKLRTDNHPSAMRIKQELC